MNKTAVKLVAVLATAILALTGCAKNSPNVAATVGTQEIAISQVDTIAKAVAAKSPDSPQWGNWRGTVLQVMIQSRLAKQAQQVAGITISDVQRQQVYATNEFLHRAGEGSGHGRVHRRLRRHQPDLGQPEGAGGHRPGGACGSRDRQPGVRAVGPQQGPAHRHLRVAVSGFVLTDAMSDQHPQLERLATVMHRLRRECPWDASQTHESLVHYLIEETLEVVEAIEAGSDTDLREELGDLLLQIYFHSEIAAEEGRFDLEQVAAQISDKLIARHPYVFADTAVPDDLNASWERAKAAEKGRASVLDGIPERMSALSRAKKILSRAADHGLDVPVRSRWPHRKPRRRWAGRWSPWWPVPASGGSTRSSRTRGRPGARGTGPPHRVGTLIAQLPGMWTNVPVCAGQAMAGSHRR